jgi:hypothetical protein
MQEVSQRMRQHGGDARVAQLSERVRKGLLRTPCDVLQDATDVDKAIRRIQACLPGATPIVTVARARADPAHALEQYQRAGLLNSTGGGAAGSLGTLDRLQAPHDAEDAAGLPAATV